MRHLKSILTLLMTVTAGLAHAGAAGQPAPLKLGQRTYTYLCTGKQTVQVTYVTTGAKHDNLPVLLVLKYQGKSYGLSEAVSGSGSRYVGLAGIDMRGLEWREHQGEATLSTFTNDPTNTKTLLTCKV